MPNGWLPIELAPQDGTPILAFEDDSDSPSVVRFGLDGKWWVVGASNYYIVPNWWRHAPAGPDGQVWEKPQKERVLFVVPNVSPEADEAS